YLDILEHNATTSLVLVLHELFSMLTLLVRRFLEELGKASQGYVITVKVRLVAITGVELHVDLAIDARFRLLVEVLTALAFDG
ncbi:hypothetical protein EGW08_022545, partial [Elysia chlorotica]